MDKKNEEEKLILRTAIDKAEANGFKGHIRYLPMSISHTGKKKRIDNSELDRIANEAFYFHAREIMFDVDFIKAFFPKNETDEKLNVIKDYHYHRATMCQTNPIKYIESYL